MEQLYAKSQASDNEETRTLVERQLQLYCRARRAAEQSLDLARQIATRTRIAKPTSRVQALQLWTTEDGELACDLISYSPYCHDLTVTYQERVVWCRAYVVRDDAFAEAGYLRGVFGGHVVQ